MILNIDLLLDLKIIKVRMFIYIFQIGKRTETIGQIIRLTKDMTIDTTLIKINSPPLLSHILYNMIFKTTLMGNKEFKKDNNLIQDNKINKIKEIQERTETLKMIFKILLNITPTLLTILPKETFICQIIIEYHKIGNLAEVYILIDNLNTPRGQENNNKTSILEIKYSTEYNYYNEFIIIEISRKALKIGWSIQPKSWIKQWTLSTQRHNADQLEKSESIFHKLIKLL